VYANAGRAHVSGMDLDLQWRALPSLLLGGGLGWLDQRFLQYGIGAGGQPIPPGSAHFFDSPAVTANVTLDYAAPVPRAYGSLNIRGGWSYRARTWFDNTASVTASQGAYSLFNANVAYRWPDGHLSLMAYGENLSNQVYLTRTANALSSLGFAIAQFGPPLTCGLRLSYAF
jgi:iron complex outermembrane receptor protein